MGDVLRSNSRNRIRSSIFFDRSTYYVAAAKLAKEAIQTGASVKNLILDAGILGEDELNEILDPFNMTNPGVFIKVNAEIP